MLTTEQKQQIAQWVKDNSENFLADMCIKVDLPVVTGMTPVLDDEGNKIGEEPTVEIHEFALVNVCITRHDCTEQPKPEYNYYEKISLN